MEGANGTSVSKHEQKGNYIITLQKNVEHPRPAKRTDNSESPFGCTSHLRWLPKLPPKKKYIVTMDRSPIKKEPADVPLLYIPKYKVNVGTIDGRHPVLSTHPKFGTRHMVLAEKPLTEIYGTGNPSLEDLRKKEDQILGVLDFHYPSIKPDWKMSFKSDCIYRESDPNFHGKFVDYKKEAWNLDEVQWKDSASKSKSKPNGLLKFAGDSYHTKYNEKFVYTPGKTGHYIERSFNPRAQNRSKHKGKVQFIENSFNPHFHNKKPKSYNKDLGHYDNLPFDPEEEFHLRHLPPIKRKGKYANVSSKVGSFENVGYKPSGGHKFYPTYELRWKTDENVEYSRQCQSYPNTVNGSVETHNSDSNIQEIQSHLEIGSITEDDSHKKFYVEKLSESPSVVTSIDGKSTSTKLTSRTSRFSGKSKVLSPTSRINTGRNFFKTDIKISHVTVGKSTTGSQICDDLLSEIPAKQEGYDVTDLIQDTTSNEGRHIHTESKTVPDLQKEALQELESNYSKAEMDLKDINGQVVETRTDVDAITESDVASLPKSYMFKRGNPLSKSNSMNSKSPISRYQKNKFSGAENPPRRQNKAIETYRYAYGPRLRQARHTSDAKTIDLCTGTNVSVLPPVSETSKSNNPKALKNTVAAIKA